MIPRSSPTAYYPNALIEAQSRARYRFAASYAGGATILDIGCGARAGSASLGPVAEFVVGVDFDPSKLQWAASTWPHPRVRYVACDGHFLPFQPQAFSIVLGLEVIEHVNDPDCFLAEARRVVRLDGLAIVSTPNQPVSSPDGILTHPDHVREYTAKEFTSLLKHYFSRVDIFGQRPLASATLTEAAPRTVYGATRFDPLGVRRMIPKIIRERVLAFLTYNLRRWKSLPQEAALTPDHYPIGHTDVEGSQTLIAVVRP